MHEMRSWADRKGRFPVEIDGIALRNDGSKVAVRLTDFSDRGCRMEGTGEFHVGEKLRIALPRMGAVKAQVRWSLPGSAGTRFLIESDF